MVLVRCQTVQMLRKMRDAVRKELTWERIHKHSRMHISAIMVARKAKLIIYGHD